MSDEALRMVPDVDALPDRVYEPFTDGPKAGRKLSRAQMKRALRSYYRIMGWNLRTGRPRKGKLSELGLDWVERQVAAPEATESRTHQPLQEGS